MWGSCDGLVIGWSVDELNVCGAALFNHSASTVKSADTGLTLNFGNA